MNLNDAARNLLVLFLFCIPICSEAGIIHGTFGGVVINAGDDSEYYSDYESYWIGNPINTQISGRFQYDTDLAPGGRLDWRGSTTSYFNRDIDYPHWLSIEFFIDGRWVKSSLNRADDSVLVETSKIIHVSEIKDETSWSYGDHFSLGDLHVTENNEGIRELTSSHISIAEPFKDIIHGLGLTQEFSWTRDYRGEWTSATYEVMGEKNGQPYRAWATMDITNFTVSPKNVPVPEPSLFYLFVISFFGLLFGASAKPQRKN